MFVINLNGFMGQMNYKQRGLKPVQNIEQQTIVANPAQPTAITDVTTDTTTQKVGGAGLRNKFKTIQLHNPENKLKKFISLKL